MTPMLVLLSLLLALAAPPLDASKVTVGPVTTVAEIDSGKLKGDPWRLAWSLDQQQFYLAGRKVNKGTAEVSHWIVDAQSGDLNRANAVPAWADEYWEWKSGQAAPGAPALKITLDTQRKNQSATSRPTGGALARGGVDPGGAGTSMDEVASQMSQNVTIIDLRFKGEVVGHWENEPMVPGRTFGWAPKGTNAIAYASTTGRLVVMDDQGRKREVESTRGVLLPAWSDDGTKLAWLERIDKKKYRIQVAPVLAASPAGSDDWFQR
jgi:hypothetical protein